MKLFSMINAKFRMYIYEIKIRAQVEYAEVSESNTQTNKTLVMLAYVLVTLQPTHLTPKKKQKKTQKKKHMWG